MAEVDEDMEDAFAAGEDAEGGDAAAVAGDFLSLELDLDYEFDASRYFDFCAPESPAQALEAELWFDSAGSYPPSPFVAKIDMGPNHPGDNVNILPKLKDTGESSHAYSEIGSCTELPVIEEAVRGVNIDSDMPNNFPKIDIKSVKKLPFSSESTLMKPTASQLAKQNHPRGIRSSGRIFHRFQKPLTQTSEKSCKSTFDSSQASKRQKLESGQARKVHDMKQQMPLVHKIPQKKEESSDYNPGLPKLKLTIPREPELGTARRARRIRPGRSTGVEVNAASTTNIFRARPLNRKILEAPSFPLPQKSTPRLPEFQEFHLKTSERAIQHVSASSSSRVQNDMASSHVQGAATGSKGLQAHSADPPCFHRLHANANLHQEGKKELKFKARPLNRKILSAKGDIGIFRSNKREITKPLGFNFKTEKRCHQNLPIELFNKLSLTSEGQQSSTSETNVSFPVHGSKENIAEHRQQDHKGIHVSKVEQWIVGRRQPECERDVVAASFRPQPNPCRSMGIR